VRKDVSSQCPDCVHLRSRIAEARQSGNKALIEDRKQALCAHFEAVKREKEVLAAEWAAALRPDADTACVTLDFMDQKSTHMPNPPHNMLNLLKGEDRLSVKVLGILWACGSKVQNAYCVPDWVPKTGDLVASCLLASMRSIFFEKRSGHLPQRLFLHVDGGSENWNIDVFDVCAYLVAADVFKEVVISRLPPGHTHGKVDQFFSVISRGLHGQEGQDTGHKSFTPQEWLGAVRKCFTMANKPNVFWVNCAWQFDALFAPVQARLRNYGATRQYTVDDDGIVSQEEGSRHHLRHVVFCAAPGSAGVTAHFAQHCVTAQLGQYYPLKADGSHSTLSDDGAAVFRPGQLPVFEPTLQQYMPNSGKFAHKVKPLMELVEAMQRMEGVPQGVVKTWAAFLFDRPCCLPGLDLDLQSWRCLPPAAAHVDAAPAAIHGRHLLPGFDPLVTQERSASDVDASLQAALARYFPPHCFDVHFASLREGDLAVALAQPRADATQPDHAFTLLVSGEETKRLELLRVNKKLLKGNQPWVKWDYFSWKGRESGLHKFVPLVRGSQRVSAEHFFRDPKDKGCEILIAWTPPADVMGEAMMPWLQLARLQHWCVPAVSSGSPTCTDPLACVA